MIPTRYRVIRTTACLTTLVLLAAATPAPASEPTFWTVATQPRFLEGEVEHVVVDSDGRVTLGPRSAVVAETEVPFIWNLAVDDDASLVAGTGTQGRVLRVTGDGESHLLFDSDEIQVHAVTRGPDGRLYVGTSPDGQVYRLDGDARATPLYDPPATYIWALAVAADGTIYVATGDTGHIYRVTPDGEGALFYDARTTHVTSLALDGDGQLLAGTASPGRVYRIDPSGKGFVLLDSGFRQIQAIHLGRDGAILAGAMNPGRSASPAADSAPSDEADGEQPPVPSVTTEVVVTGIGEVQVSEAPEPQRPTPASPGSPRGAVFRIETDGMWSTLWESDSDLPYDVLEEDAGSVLVATGNEGKVYRLDGDPVRTSLVARASAQQVTRLARAPDALYFATANPGTIYRLATTRATEGTFTSNVRDAETAARWGTIRWRAHLPPGTSIELSTRTGNTSRPDATWSDWSAVYTDQSGSPIESPAARYIQWRAHLRGSETASPALTSVTTSYVTRNRRPEVTAVTVHPPGVVFERPFSADEKELAGLRRQPAAQRAAVASMAAAARPGTLGRKLYQKGLQTVTWDARDDDDDPLVFDVLFRRVGETEWMPIERQLIDAVLTWDTTSVADGTYVIRVVASDRRGNAPERARTGERESAPFEIDNTPPVIERDPDAPEAGRTLGIVVRDSHSPIRRVEYSTDAVTWRQAYPTDGIADGPVERYELHLDEPRPARVIVRASDAMANIATREFRLEGGAQDR